MRRFCPSLTELLAFEAAARHGSFTRAAEELCVTQGAVSKQLKNLEAMVGVELFLRIRQGLVLTDAGRGYLDQIKGGLDQIESASLDLLAHRGQGGLLTLTSMPTFGAKWLIPRLTAFLRLRPDIRMEFLPHHRGYDFSIAKLDAAVRYGEGLWPGARADYLGGREVVPVCKPQLIVGGSRRPADLLRYPLLHHTTAPQGWHEWFERAGCASARSWEGSRFDQYSLLTEAAAAGFGLALIPRCLVEDELRDGKLEVAVNLPILASQGYYLCYPEQKAKLPALQAFRAWLLTQVPPDPVPGGDGAAQLECRDDSVVSPPPL